MVEHALADKQSEWTHTDENLAMLIDRLDYWLTTEYAGWVTDPDDPEVKRARAERKRSGKKPPPVPIIPPIAKRPPEKAKAVRELADQMRDYYENPPVEKPGESKMNALDRLLG